MNSFKTPFHMINIVSKFGERLMIYGAVIMILVLYILPSFLYGLAFLSLVFGLLVFFSVKFNLEDMSAGKTRVPEQLQGALRNEIGRFSRAGIGALVGSVMVFLGLIIGKNFLPVAIILFLILFLLFRRVRKRSAISFSDLDANSEHGP